jgi:phosphoserine phosphatase
MVCWYRSHDRATLLRHVQTAAVLAAVAREGVANLKRAGVQVALVSITWQFAVQWLATESAEGKARRLSLGPNA